MADNVDIMLDQNNEDRIENGDFVIGIGDQDDVMIIVSANPGAIKFDAMLGPGLIQMMNSATAGPTQLIQKIKLHLNRDNKYPQKVRIQDGQLAVDI